MTVRQRSWSVRLYALLLHLYPEAFRREYGESMLQLFEDQRRSVRGGGGHAMLWLKTLRDLLRSVPDVRSDDARPSGVGARVLWPVVVVIGVVFLLNALVLPSWIARMPSAEAPVAAQPLQPVGEYQAIAQMAAGLVSTLLAMGTFLFAARRSVATGLAAFIVGAALTFIALAMNPWLWVPFDRYPAAVAWALGIWPLAATAWAALIIVRRRRGTRGV